ncbi:MAG: dephospho-CoA kinase [Syntrophomonas sp.]|nr:dephospho-CoA kinase [Syntrophomonas sp.]
MIIIGLTGGIASGKSTVAKTLAEMGALIIDGDETAHQLMEPHKAAWEDIVQAFGREILNPDMTINRLKLGAIVFEDDEQLEVLNRITHPLVLESFKSQILQIKAIQHDAVVIMDVPLLYEAHMDKLCDQVWVVWVDRETQIKRLMERNHFTREEAVKRIKSQMSLDEKAKRADVVIDNSNNIEETIRSITRNFKDIL